MARWRSLRYRGHVECAKAVVAFCRRAVLPFERVDISEFLDRDEAMRQGAWLPVGANSIERASACRNTGIIHGPEGSVVQMALVKARIMRSRTQLVGGRSSRTAADHRQRLVDRQYRHALVHAMHDTGKQLRVMAYLP